MARPGSCMYNLSHIFISLVIRYRGKLEERLPRRSGRSLFSIILSVYDVTGLTDLDVGSLFVWKDIYIERSSLWLDLYSCKTLPVWEIYILEGAVYDWTSIRVITRQVAWAFYIHIVNICTHFVIFNYIRNTYCLSNLGTRGNQRFTPLKTLDTTF